MFFPSYVAFKEHMMTCMHHVFASGVLEQTRPRQENLYPFPLCFCPL